MRNTFDFRITKGIAKRNSLLFPTEWRGVKRNDQLIDFQFSSSIYFQEPDMDSLQVEQGAISRKIGRVNSNKQNVYG